MSAKAVHIIRVAAQAVPRAPFRDSPAREFQYDTEAAIAAHNGGAQRMVGEIVQYGGERAPSGWLICDGSALSRRDYSALFEVLGTRYGDGGDGSTTFRIPTQAECEPDPAAVLPPQTITGGSVEPEAPSTPTPGTPGAGGGNTVVGGRPPTLRGRDVPEEVSPE